MEKLNLDSKTIFIIILLCIFLLILYKIFIKESCKCGCGSEEGFCRKGASGQTIC